MKINDLKKVEQLNDALTKLRRSRKEEKLDVGHAYNPNYRMFVLTPEEISEHIIPMFDRRIAEISAELKALGVEVDDNDR